MKRIENPIPDHPVQAILLYTKAAGTERAIRDSFFVRNGSCQLSEETDITRLPDFLNANSLPESMRRSIETFVPDMKKYEDGKYYYHGNPKGLKIPGKLFRRLWGGSKERFSLVAKRDNLRNIAKKVRSGRNRKFLKDQDSNPQGSGLSGAANQNPTDSMKVDSFLVPALPEAPDSRVGLSGKLAGLSLKDQTYQEEDNNPTRNSPSPKRHKGMTPPV